MTKNGCWRQLKRNFIQLLSLADKGGESFSIYFWKFWPSQGGLLFYGFHKGDERADTELMFQYYMRNSLR